MEYEHLRKYWDAGIAITIGAISFLLSADRLKEQILAGTVEGWIDVGVLAVTLYWLLDFILNTLTEPELFKKAGIVEKVKMEDWKAYIVAIAVSLGFGGLIASVMYPIRYSVLATGIQLADCIGVTLIQRALFEVNMESPLTGSVLFEFYFYKPHLIHRSTKLVGFMAALSCAVAARYSGHVQFRIASSLIIVLTIAGGELTLLFWRRWRKAKLAAPGGHP